MRLYVKIISCIGVICLLFCCAAFFGKFSDNDFSRVVSDSKGGILRVYLNKSDQWRIRVRLDQVSPLLVKFVTQYEDRYFYVHPGINPISLIKAFSDNLRAGKIMRGGSTITMQVARMLYKNKKRSYANKIIEIMTAFMLEIKYSKNEIMEMYLNYAPYGGNCEGVAAASMMYFGKMPSQLSISEAAVITMIPKSPTKYRPDLNPAAAKKNRDKILDILYSKRIITEKEYKSALEEKIPAKKNSMPFKAPHFCEWITQIEPYIENINSTIDPDIQTITEKISLGYMTELENKNITNCAVVVLDNKTNNILAMVGSRDYYNIKNQGQVNGALAPRSPGSLLKPFLYARAIDKGALTPRRMLYDVPVSYSGYEPNNNDDLYRGLVSVRDALRLSLNVPAVNVNAELKNDGIYDILRSYQISTINKPKEYYGLPLILGACEISLLELASMYTSLANEGVYVRPHAVMNKNISSFSQQMFEPGSVWMITSILADVKRPDLPASWDMTIDLPKIAWKTGTSYGHKDAWSIGYNPIYTIGVWVGNFNGKGVYDIAGAYCAGPLLFRLFNELMRDKDVVWYSKPDELQERTVCALTGLPVNENCPIPVKDYFLTNKSEPYMCSVHRSFEIDKKSGMAVCPYCRGSKTTVNKVYEQWPAQYATLLKKVRYPVQRIPAHNTACTAVKCGENPVIVSPDKDCTYHLGKFRLEEHQKILLACSVQNNVKKIYWFVDNELLFKGQPNERFFYYPKKGKHSIVLMDDEGRTDQRILQID